MPYKTTGPCIYGIFNVINSHVYLGSAARSFLDRRRVHLRDLRKGKHHCQHLQRSWNKYGELAFVFVVLEEVTNVDDLLAVEQMWIDEHRLLGATIYNAAPRAGSGWGIRWSEASKQAKSAQVAAWSASPERRAELSMRARRTDEPYSLVSPDGVLYENIANLREFGRQHNLQPALLIHVCRGTRPHHKGWTRPGATLAKRPKRAAWQTSDEVAAHIRSVTDDKSLSTAAAKVSRTNQGKKVRGTSQFVGVSWIERYQRWSAAIAYKGEVFTLGRFEHEEEAARRYNQVAVALYGSEAKLNNIDPVL